MITPNAPSATGPTPKRHGIQQYPELEERIQKISAEVQQGFRDEDCARQEIASHVFASGLIANTVYRHLQRSGSLWHLYDDLLLLAENRTYRSITGQVIGERMREVDMASGTILDLGVVASGRSAVGYLRQGLIQDMSALRRNLYRSSGRSICFSLSEPDVDDDTVEGWHASRLYNHIMSMEDASRDDRVGRIYDNYAKQMARRGVRKTVAQAQAVSTFYQVPLAYRPLYSWEREALLEQVERDPYLAIRSLRQARARGFVELTGAMVLWRHYDEDLAGVLLESPRAAQAAHALARAALSRLPVRGTSVVRPMTTRLSRMFRDAGAPVELVPDLVASFVSEELEIRGPSLVPEQGTWVDIARMIRHSHPRLLGSSVYSIREELFRISDTEVAATISRAA